MSADVNLIERIPQAFGSWRRPLDVAIRLGVRERTVRRWINDLAAQGYKWERTDKVPVEYRCTSVPSKKKKGGKK